MPPTKEQQKQIDDGVIRVESNRVKQMRKEAQEAADKATYAKRRTDEENREAARVYRAPDAPSTKAAEPPAATASASQPSRQSAPATKTAASGNRK